MVETIQAAGQPLAIIVRAADRGRGTEFVTPPETSLQLAMFSHARGYVVAPHFHPVVSRTVETTCETLVVRSGRIRVDLFDAEHRYFTSRELGSGDVVLLLGGGHGVEVLEDVDLVEVKTGPFVGGHDKQVLANPIVPASPRPTK